MGQEAVTSQVAPYILLSIAATASLLISALYVWSYRPRLLGAVSAAILFLAGAEWMLASTVGLASTSFAAKVLWDKAQYLGMVVVPTAWLAFTLQYTGRAKKLAPRTLCLLSVVPLITVLLVFTNDAHGLIWSRVVLDTSRPFVELDKTYGAGFWVFISYSYSLVLFAAALLAQMAVRSPRLYRWPAASILCAMAVPWLLSALEVLDLNPLPTPEPTVLGLAVAGPILAWALPRFWLGNVGPVAREAIIERMGDGVLVLDEEDRVVDLNPVAERLLSCTLAEVIGQPAAKVWPRWPDRLLEATDPTQVGAELVLGTGDLERVYDIRISDLVDWRGHVSSRVAVLRDITERKRAEDEALRRSDELAALNAIAMNVTSTLELEEILRTIQKSVLRILGEKYAPLFALFNEKDQTLDLVLTGLQEQALRAAENLVGLKLDQLTLPVAALNRDMWDALLARKPYVATEGPNLVESSMYRTLIQAVQTAMEAKCMVHLPLWVRGKLVGSMLVFLQRERVSDEEIEVLSAVASQAAIAIENARLFDELTTTLRERNTAQAQLIQTARLSAIGEMISGVAHELNNPLTAVMGYAELLQATDLDAAVKDDLRRIYDSAMRAHRIVQNLLAFARQKKPQRSLADINELIERTFSLRRHHLEVDNVQIVTDLAENLPWTMADVSQLLQVFLNIINNAHQAMVGADGGGVLTVKSELMDEDTIRLTFADTGPGIPEEILGRIFDAFFTTQEVGTGTGLGLSVSHGIVQEHGGRIWAESEPGRGATLFVELPVTTWAETIPVPTPEDDHQRISAASKRILVIDDEPATVDMIVQVLKESGYQVDGVKSADLAIEKLHQERYDLVVSYIEMPGIDGPTCMEEVKAVDPELAQRMIFITAGVLNPTTQAFLQTSGARCIEKPFRLEHLTTAVAEALGLETSARGSPTPSS